MSDSAVGSVAGYIFQFEKALLMLSRLKDGTDYISIESVDDIAAHEAKGSVLLTVQAKHSLLVSGKTFEDTSKSLWRTLEIWIQKLETGIFDLNTEFVCSTNKAIPATSLLSRIKSEKIEDVFETLKNLLADQIIKRDSVIAGGGTASSIKQTMKLIEFVLSKPTFFQTIKENLKIQDEENIKSNFLKELHLDTDLYTDITKDSIYDEFYGWIMLGSTFKWKNSEAATFSKKQFNDKYLRIKTNPSIMEAIFRAKENLGSIEDHIIDRKKGELFVKQLDDIARRKEAKDRIIQNAILDYIYSEIEIKHIVDKGDHTDVDFEKFMEQCKEAWQLCFDNNVIHEIEDYNETQRNEIAIEVYNVVMNNIEIKFKEGFGFTTRNKYIRNGCFLQLSNKPEIGWRPDWEGKYKI
jgi:hypothetical protein